MFERLAVFVLGHARSVAAASVLVFLAESEEASLGGAASVAMMLRYLDAQVSVAGVVGDDNAGRALRKLLADLLIASDLVLTDESRPTTAKERLMKRASDRHPHQILVIFLGALIERVFRPEDSPENESE